MKAWNVRPWFDRSSIEHAGDLRNFRPLPLPRGAQGFCASHERVQSQDPWIARGEHLKFVHLFQLPMEGFYAVNT